MYRIGHGFDVHKLESGYPLILGGVNIPWHLGAVGHSDADTLTHAICDALLGAAALADIGTHFPDTDSTYRGIRSTLLLAKVVDMIKTNGYKIGNIDCTIALEKPKVGDYIPEIKKNIADILNIEPTSIGIKATTTETLGFIGRNEGIAVWVVALLLSEKVTV